MDAHDRLATRTDMNRVNHVTAVVAKYTIMVANGLGVAFIAANVGISHIVVRDKSSLWDGGVRCRRLREASLQVTTARMSSPQGSVRPHNSPYTH